MLHGLTLVMMKKHRQLHRKVEYRNNNNNNNNRGTYLLHSATAY